MRWRSWARSSPPRRELEHSTLAARLNGLAKGYTNRQTVLDEIAGWQLSAEQLELYLDTVRRIRW